MTKRILLVRAVNVGGAKLPMAEFREMLAGLGGAHVRTYIQSGNAVLDIPGDPAAFDRAVEGALTDRYGYVREVISRSRRNWNRRCRRIHSRSSNRSSPTSSP